MLIKLIMTSLQLLRVATNDQSCIDINCFVVP